MNNVKLSIIIPMYNSEKYIGNCLDSILKSDLPFDKYEVIIVNDGSVDNGPSIAKKYVESYANIIYLTQKNQGQSCARNYGIKECHGEFVWCVDSDDIVDSHLKQLLDFLEKYSQVDILAFKLKRIFETGLFDRYECMQPSVKHGVLLEGRDAIISGYNPSSVCALLIRKELIESNNLYFKRGITHQDVELSYKLFAYASQVLFTDMAPYIYILHPTSTSQSINPKKKLKYLFDDLEIIKSFRNLSQQFYSKDPMLAYTIGNRADNVLFGMLLSMFKQRKLWGKNGINKALLVKLKTVNMFPVQVSFDNYKKNLFKYMFNIWAKVSS